MEGGGQITTVARNSGNIIEITVGYARDASESDEGMIQDPSCSSEATEESTPMDLSICYNIMGHHGGDLHLERFPGGARKFVLQFPSIMP